MFRRLFICLSIVLTLLCFITSCKKDSAVKDKSEENVEHNKHVSKDRDLVIRDDKTVGDDNSAETEDNETETTDNSSEETENENVEETDQRVYDVAETLPEFPGGLDALNKYIAARTPSAGAEAGIHRKMRTMVSFIIEKDGSLSSVGVAKSSGDAALDKAAVQIVSDMPLWTPATNHGDSVRMRFIVSVVFNPRNNI